MGVFVSLELDQNNAKYQIKAYISGMIRINDKEFSKSLIVSANELIEDWSPQTVSQLTPESLNIILSLKPDILLIGTGSTHKLIPVTIYGNLINAGIGVEVMETGAACRTFNALCAENRNVVAALIIT